MAPTSMATLLVCHGGHLDTSTDFSPMYYGGENTLIEIPVSTNLCDLKLNVLHALEEDFITHTCDIICRLPVGSGYSATAISNDSTCKIMLKKAVKNVISIYVTINYVGGPNLEEEAQFQNMPHVYRPTPHPYSQFESGSSSRHSVDIPQSYYPSQYEDTTRHSFHIPSYEPHSFEPYRQRFENISIREEDDQEIQEGYETMGTGSPDSSNAEEGENNEGHNIIRDSVLNDTTAIDNMVATNEYVEIIRTAQEWDAVNDCNPTSQRHINDDDKVPEEFFEGMTFGDKNQLLFALMGWSIINNVEYHKVCSNKTRLSVECIYRNDNNQPCPWRLYAVRNPARASYWKISKLRGPHCCTHPVMATGHKNLSAKFISNYIGDTVRIQVDVKPREIIAIINAKYNVRTTYYKAWDAKNKAIARIFGSYEKSYASLYRLMESIRDVMPGSVYRIQENNGRFQSVFWSFGASIAAWEFCRPVLSLDGTFLVGKYKGTLLAAVGQDADDGLFPFAFAIVESESTESWTWFLQALLDLVHPISTRGDLCIISDKHPGLIRGCRDILPWVKHVHCLRHLRENFKKFLRTQPVVDVEGLCNKMYSAGHTDEERHFKRLMREILAINKEAHDWLIQKDITKWTLVHDGGSRYGNMTTNSSESFNAVLKKARGLPIQGLIISIYYQLVNMFNKRSEDGQKMIGRLAPSVQIALQKVEDIVRQFPTPQIINPHEFQVFDKQGRGHKVEIIDNVTCTCSCKKTEMYHIPCVHAIVALSARRINHHNFVSKYYTIQMYRETYAFEFHFIPDREFWPEFDVSAGIIPLLPPNMRRRSGRPRHARIRTTMDENRASTGRKCSLCHEIGHNKATCPRNPSIRPYRERRSNRPPPC